MSCNVLSPSITIIIQAETLFELEERTEDKNLKYVFQTYLLTLAKFALGICCDNKLAHVVLVTSSNCNPRDFEKSMKHLSIFSHNTELTLDKNLLWEERRKRSSYKRPANRKSKGT